MDDTTVSPSPWLDSILVGPAEQGDAEKMRTRSRIKTKAQEVVDRIDGLSKLCTDNVGLGGKQLAELCIDTRGNEDRVDLCNTGQETGEDDGSIEYTPLTDILPLRTE